MPNPTIRQPLGHGRNASYTTDREAIHETFISAYDFTSIGVSLTPQLFWGFYSHKIDSTGESGGITFLKPEAFIHLMKKMSARLFLVLSRGIRLFSYIFLIQTKHENYQHLLDSAVANHLNQSMICSLPDEVSKSLVC
jgi:hypothetical protein